MLQVGSFREFADADRLRALTLGGHRTHQSVAGRGSELWHRVRSGPHGDLVVRSAPAPNSRCLSLTLWCSKYAAEQKPHVAPQPHRVCGATPSSVIKWHAATWFSPNVRSSELLGTLLGKRTSWRKPTPCWWVYGLGGSPEAERVDLCSSRMDRRMAPLTIAQVYGCNGFENNDTRSAAQQFDRDT